MVGADQVCIELLALRPADGQMIVGQGVMGAGHVGGLGDQIQVAAALKLGRNPVGIRSLNAPVVATISS